jgi:hypothetical protein
MKNERVHPVKFTRDYPVKFTRVWRGTVSATSRADAVQKAEQWAGQIEDAEDAEDENTVTVGRPSPWQERMVRVEGAPAALEGQCADCNGDKPVIEYADGSMHCMACEVTKFRRESGGLSPQELLDAHRADEDGKIPEWLVYRAKFLLPVPTP